MGRLPPCAHPPPAPARTPPLTPPQFAHLPSGRFYNGCTENTAPGANRTRNLQCGIQMWAQHGIAARALLLDFGRWAAAQRLRPDAFAATNITLAQLRAVAAAQGLDLARDTRVGDVLLVRTGFTAAYRALTPAQRVALAARPYTPGPDGAQRFIGVEGSAEAGEWMHDAYFSAVAADSPAFESWPPQGTGLSLHERLLSLWGVGLGEFFDLERLAERCAARKRWTFFFTSAPFNVEGE